MGEVIDAHNESLRSYVREVIRRMANEAVLPFEYIIEQLGMGLQNL
jgi:hypothetical protein